MEAGHLLARPGPVWSHVWSCNCLHYNAPPHALLHALLMILQSGLAHISELLDEGKVKNIHGLFRQNQIVRAKVSEAQ